MVIDLREYKQRGEKSGVFSFDYRPREGLLPLLDSEITSCRVQGEFFIEEAAVQVFGKVEFGICAPCARCLSPARATVSAEFDEKFAFYDGDEEANYRVERDKLNLDKLIDDTILSETPIGVYCKPDCKGLCPVCGANLNEGDCKCGDNS